MQSIIIVLPPPLVLAPAKHTPQSAARDPLRTRRAMRARYPHTRRAHLRQHIGELLKLGSHLEQALNVTRHVEWPGVECNFPQRGKVEGRTCSSTPVSPGGLGRRYPSGVKADKRAHGVLGAVEVDEEGPQLARSVAFVVLCVDTEGSYATIGVAQDDVLVGVHLERDERRQPTEHGNADRRTKAKDGEDRGHWHVQVERADRGRWNETRMSAGEGRISIKGRSLRCNGEVDESSCQDRGRRARADAVNGEPTQIWGRKIKRRVGFCVATSYALMGVFFEKGKFEAGVN
ncbi:hypothetical protein B0H19DRAFT_1244364 [Mycena capillaripes]|nr:hypothetical protein B0H19DRAFT_1244364 [Mycena capillaripes]